MNATDEGGEGLGIAVIGMAGRFPGAGDLHQFWDNLCRGVESVTSFTDGELLQAGVAREELESGRYVKAAPVLQDIESFDAGFFGYTPLEARLMDPQQRILLECAWEALEHAGYDPGKHPEPIGVFAGTRTSTYLFHVLANRAALQPQDRLLVEIGNDVSSLATRLSYKLNLRGPSYMVQTACSTSLAAIHLACHSLLLGECRMALAGATAVMVPHRVGYLYDPASMLAPDGHCRSFDEKAQGTVFGSGAGVVLLKRLEDALADGDQVLAVVRGTAVNNDGAVKASFTAPSVEGQTDVIMEALACAGVEADSISYLEAHGTGTPLGDPIEILALRNAYRASTSKKGFCRLGTVKSNVGHLDVTAGMAGLIKTVLALQHRQIPPSLNFSKANPEIDFTGSPFTVNTRLTPWTGPAPLRAGISSFGFGGTNTHVILEEAPPPPPSGASRPWQLLVWSARSASALDAATANLASHLKQHPEVPLADVAYTLQVGRRDFDHRRALICRDVADALAALEEPPSRRLLSGVRTSGERPVAFLFPGLGAQHAGMAEELYRGEPVFREEVDRCAELARSRWKLDLRSVLYPERAAAEESARRLEQAELAEPALFTVEYALARLWMSWGIHPAAMIGHGVGECVAACLAGVLSLEDALALVIARGPLSKGGAFSGEVRRATLAPPKLRIVSGFTGGWLTPAEAMDPGYWVRHLKEPIHLARGLRELLQGPGNVLLEVGPGERLGELARRQPEAAGRPVLASLPLPSRPESSDVASMMRALGQLWLAGAPVPWKELHASERRRRVWLPAYPFERQRHWVDPPRNAPAASMLQAAQDWTQRRQPVEDWFYVPGWKLSAPPREGAVHQPVRCLLLGDGGGLGACLAELLAREGHDVITATPGPRYAWASERSCTLDPRQAEGYASLMKELDASGRWPQVIVHLWSTLPAGSFEETQDLGFRSLLSLAQAIGERPRTDPLQLAIVSHQVHEIESGDALAPERATVMGPCRVIPREYPYINCRNIDVVLPAPGTPQQSQLAAQLARELVGPGAEQVVGYRGRNRWVQEFEHVRLERPASPAPRLRPHGRYLITGGLGGVGLVMAELLARTVKARIALVGRSSFCPREEWGAWLSAHGDQDATSVKIRKLQELEAAGAEVLVASADVTRREQVAAVLEQMRERWGGVDGVLHLAGLPGGGVLQLKKLAEAEQVMAPKIQGARVLDEVLRGVPLDFLVLFSSITSIVGEMGQIDYCAANAFLETFARDLARRGTAALAINWDMWHGAGMAVDSHLAAPLKAWREIQLKLAIRADEGSDAFHRLLAAGMFPQVIVSTTQLPALLEQFRALAQAGSLAQLTGQGGDAVAQPRPELMTPYVEPRSDAERTVAGIWQTLLGVNPVGINDDFSELGGHSLLATQLRNQIYAAFKVDLSLRSLFEAPTVAGIAALVEKESGKAAVAEKPIADRLRVAFPTERPALLEGYLRRRVAKGLKRAEGDLPANGSLEGLDLQLVGAELEYDLKQDFKFQLFPHEVREHPSFPALAKYLLAEMERQWNPSRLVTDRPLSAYPLLPYRKQAARTVKREGKNRSMAFVHSSPRAGSTLFRVMLAGHPGLFCPPELNLLFFETMKEWRQNIGFGHEMEWTEGGLLWALMELQGLDSAAGQAVVDQLVADDASVQALYARLQELSGPRLLVDKTPPYSMDPATLRRAEEMFDGPRHIYLYRHPYPVMESIVRLRMDRLFGPSLFGSADVDPHVVAETVWAISNRNLLDFFDGIDRERCHWVRYEDLVRDPARVMAGVCDFLGIRFNEQVLRPYDGKRERMMGGLGDPNIMQHTAIDAGLGESWKRIRWPRSLDPTTRALVARLGYELPDSAVPVPSGAPAPALSAAEAEKLLANLDQLPDDQVAALLAQLSPEKR